MVIIFIGNRFYLESKSHMSSYYAILADGSWDRCTIGEVEGMVESGITITIRKATNKELAQAEEMLKRLPFC